MINSIVNIRSSVTTFFLRHWKQERIYSGVCSNDRCEVRRTSPEQTNAAYISKSVQIPKFLMKLDVFLVFVLGANEFRTSGSVGKVYNKIRDALTN